MFSTCSDGSRASKPVEATPTVEELVEELALAGASRFHASFVAERAGLDFDSVQGALRDMVGRGELSMSFELTCPDGGETLAVFGPGEKLPLGSDYKCDEHGSEPFLVDESAFWVTFTPTSDLLLRVNRAEATAGSKQKKPCGRARRSPGGTGRLARWVAGCGREPG